MNELPRFEELCFNETYHKYSIHTVELPSVTTIMKPLSEDIYGTIDRGVLAHAAAKGIAVHAAIENYYKFGIVDIPDDLRGYMDAFITWNNLFHPEVLATECRMYHKTLMYAGTADIVAVIEGKRTIIDIKTSVKVQRYLTAIQLEAYRKGYESHGFNIPKKATLQLKNDGTFAYDNSYPEKDFKSVEVIGALLVIHNYRKNNRGM